MQRRLALALLLAACGAPTPAPARAVDSDPDVATARTEARAMLASTFRLVFSSRARLYRGAIEAHDAVQPSAGELPHDLAGPVAGWIDGADARGQTSMLLVARDREQLLEMWQPAPGTTGFSIISSWSWSSLTGPTCEGGCVTPFTDAPAAVHLEVAEELVQAHGDIVRATWNELDARQLWVLMRRACTETAMSPVLEGDRVRVPVHGLISLPFTAEAPPEHPECMRTRAYLATVTLDPAHATIDADIESIGPPTTRCCEGVPATCSPAQCVTL